MFKLDPKYLSFMAIFKRYVSFNLQYPNYNLESLQFSLLSWQRQYFYVLLNYAHFTLVFN